MAELVPNGIFKQNFQGGRACVAGDKEAKGEWVTTQVAQAHYRNAGVTLACKRCCVTNGYLQLGLYGM